MHPSSSSLLMAVFFVQGLAFFALGISILVATRPRAALAIGRSLWLLTAFGFLHSAASWIELAGQLLPEDSALIPPLAPLPALLLVLYSACLAQFGANVVSALAPRYRRVRTLPLVLLLWAAIPCLVLVFQDGLSASADLAVAEAVARYVVYLPGGLIGALAFLLQSRASSYERLPDLRRDCRLAALAFVLYSLSGGVLVPTSILYLGQAGFGYSPSAVAELPVQVVRLLLAPVIAWVVVRTLRVFELEQLLEVEDLNRQLQRLSRAVVTAQEEERRRIALELHDDTAQLLSSLLVHLKLLQGTQNPQDVGLRCAELMKLASEAIQSIRHMANQLRPVALDDLGLVAALQWHVERFSERERLPVELKAAGIGGRFDPEIELAVYRIVQECLRNIAKHARAHAVEIRLEMSDGKLVVTVADDGCGFDPFCVRRSENAGLGLLGMSERAALVGGALSVRSRPGSGTVVRVEIPLRAAARSRE